MRLFFLLFLALATGAGRPERSAPPAVNPLAYVDPFIGTGGHGHTYPGATAPFGMVQLSPDTRPTTLDWDGCSGYHDSDSLIYGFSHTHLSGTGVPDYCDLLLQPYTGRTYLEKEAYASAFRKENEKAEAGYYRVLLDRNNILAELTATERVGVHRYTFPKSEENAHILIDLRHRDEVLESALTPINDREVVGSRISKGWAEEQRLYFHIRFSKPFFNAKVHDMTLDPIISQRAVKGKAITGRFDFKQDGAPLVVTVGISAVSIEGARQNLEAECDHFDFDRIKAETQAKWSERLSRISVEGGSEAQLRAYYTALYHTMVAPNLWSDVDGRYRGHDKEIHKAEGHEVYTVFSLWDTYRACHPLYTVLEPERVDDFIHSFLRQYEQRGRLPVWELAANETDCMIGNHSIPVIADAWLKGIRGYDGNQALDAMVHTALLEKAGMPLYRRDGYIASDLESESVSKTLEYAFDDWAVARMAKALGREDVYRTFIQSAQYYRNLYDPSSGFFRAKNNATWYDPFDPYEVNFNYTEANAWQYALAAPQDISGMIALHGGPEAFAAFLDRLFTAKTEVTGRNQADITGLIGQYVQGNEPSHHMAYLYNFAGQPWKTQARVRQIMDTMYSDQPDGLSGNEDCGQMSAWLVWSGLGLYPAVPVGGQYVIGTPWFEETTLMLPGNKSFVVRAPGASSKKTYIKSARLNGKALTRSWISHEELMAGGELLLEMSDKPSIWGSGPAERPVQAITDHPIVPAPYVLSGKRVFPDTQTIELGCLDPEAEILYTFGPADSPLGSWNWYESPLRIDTTVTLSFIARKGASYSPAAHAKFSRLRSDIRIHRYNTRYDNQYTGRGESGLVDLLDGGADFRSGGWQGFQGVDVDVVLDLGAVKELRRVSGNFLQDENSWIFFPTGVVVEISEDGATFQPLGTVENDVAPDVKGTLQKTFRVEAAGARARYVRFVGKTRGVCPPGHKGAGYPAWLFIDEISVE